MDANVRQERRRKIMERGSDRLALITGQVRTLSESPSLSPQRQRHAHTESSPSIILSTNDNPQISADPEEKDDASEAKFTKVRTINEYPTARIFHRGNEEEPRLVKCLTTPDSITKLQQQDSEIIPSIQKASTQPNFVSSKRINTCIVASERMRAICSLIIAFLVVISYTDYPLLGLDIMSSESFIVSRPFYIILLTDVTIVLAQLLLESGNDSEEVEKEITAAQEDEDNWVGAAKLLERGLVLYQVTCGLFNDCSIYLVVVICGLSLV